MVLAIIQARCGSKRLPGKVLYKIGGITVLEFMYQRVMKSKFIDKIIIATSVNSIDDPIEELCLNKNIEYYRGSENDVLDRFFKAALKFNPDLIVRLTADCPLIDYNLIDKTVKLYKIEKVDFASNTVPPENRRYPDGTDVEVFSFNLLKLATENSFDEKEREHVTFYFWKSGDSFSKAILNNHENWSKYRYTLDYKEDFNSIKEIIKELNKRNQYGYTHEIVRILEDKKEIFEINAKFNFGENW